MSTTIFPPAVIVILSSLLLIFLSVSASASQWEYHLTTRRHYYGRHRHFRPRLNQTRHIPVSSSPRGQGVRLLAREFLNAHNKVRTSYGLPPLVWDSTLARYARHYGATRMFDCKMQHSMGQYGENLFWGGRDHWTPAEVVKSWADENEFYDVNKNTCKDGEMCGHYTQIIWKSTTKVGCARQKCATGGLIVICNYDPPGNYVGEHPFGAPPSSDGENSPSTPSTPSSQS